MSFSHLAVPSHTISSLFSKFSHAADDDDDDVDDDEYFVFDDVGQLSNGASVYALTNGEHHHQPTHLHQKSIFDQPAHPTTSSHNLERKIRKNSQILLRIYPPVHRTDCDFQECADSDRDKYLANQFRETLLSFNFAGSQLYL